MKQILNILSIFALLLSSTLVSHAQVDVASGYCDNISVVSFKIITTDKGDIAEVVLKNDGTEELIDTQLSLELDQPGPVSGSPTLVDVDQWPGFGGTIVATFSVQYIGIGVPDDMDVEGIESANENDYLEPGIGVPDDMDVTGIIKVVNSFLNIECLIDITYNSANICNPCLRVSSEDSNLLLGSNSEIEIPLYNSTNWSYLNSELLLKRNDFISIDGESHKVSRIPGNDSYNSFMISLEYDIIDGAVYSDESVDYSFTIYGDATKLYGCECEGTLALRRNETGGIINTDELLVEAKLYPNPVRDKLNIRLKNASDRNVSLHITNVSGRTLESSILIDNNTTIDVSSYPVGIYTVNIISNNEIKSDKIIIR